MYCHNCGKENVEEAKFCVSCGCSFDTPQKKIKEGSIKQKNVVIALVLGLVILIIIILIAFFSKKTAQDSIGVIVESSERSQEKETQQETVFETDEQESIIPFSTNQSGEFSTGISPASFILPESNSKVYSADELKLLNGEQLRLARNEIFARYGRKFSSEDLQSYFSAQPWYTPKYEASEFDALGDGIFNEFEIANRKQIVDLENNGIKEADKTPSGDINYKGNYELKGDEYIFVDKYYIENGILYIEGEYCDGIDNPEGEFEADMIRFVTIKEHIKVRMDNNTIFPKDYEVTNIYETKKWIDDLIYWFTSTAVCVELDGDYVKEYFGNWQSS